MQSVQVVHTGLGSRILWTDRGKAMFGWWAEVVR